MKSDDVPGWSFEVEETSANCYMVLGTGPEGQTIKKQGLDPDALLNEVKEEALTSKTQRDAT